MKRSGYPFLSCFVLFMFAGAANAEPAAPLSALAQMPVKEITVFKDGHAFVMHEGKMPTDAGGNVVMDYLPTPVMGTFWPFSADRQAKLSSVVSSQRKVLVPRTAVSYNELMLGNTGSSTQVVANRGQGEEMSTVTVDAEVMGVLQRSSEELEQTSPPNSGEKLPQISDLVMLKTPVGTEVLDMKRIDSMTFKGDFKTKFSHTEFRNLLTLKMDWGKSKASDDAQVGLMYLQKGVRWIPNYKVSLDGSGNARVTMQATLVNELADLNDVTAHLVIGVPTFAFADNVDPISLQQNLAHLSGFFKEQNANSQYGYLSNAIMTQTAERRSMADAEGVGGTPDGPEVSGATKAEDLYVFTVKHITLKKGQRMVLPVYETQLKYKDVYTLDIPFTPPLEIRQQYHGQPDQLERLLAAPKFMHKVRLTNTGEHPLTTAPALILRDNKLLAQGLMTYTARGSESDLSVTTAVDLKVKKTDKESGRIPNAVKWQGYEYGKIELAGNVCVTNYLGKTAELEVRRNVLGKLESADHGGKVDMVNVFEDDEYGGRAGLPDWWRWFSWPDWWTRVNGVGRVTWKMPLEPGKTVDLSYKWNYYWR